ncbi:MAG: NUDIX hydrolase [Phycisphaeraceae bacterium]|nr:MAG: NUDIX hydrolase [Phycisphaeraceae bacterium]
MNDHAWSRYQALVAADPALFAKEGKRPIEILTAAEEINRAREATAARLREAGHPEEWARPGLHYEDEYFRVLRDPVRFASGKLGMYVRIIPPAVARGSAGAAILPILGDDKVVLLNHYRHATRQWHLEIPRGFAEAGETCEAAARRELKEEIGSEDAMWTPLGQMHTNTGLTSDFAHLFVAHVMTWDPAKAKNEESEGMEVPLAQFRSKIASGEITDSFTIAAWTRAAVSGLLE